MIEIAALIAFLIALALLAYTYVGYPILVYLLSRVSPQRHEKQPIEPTVTILITAFNEESAIAAKLDNTLALAHSAEKLEVLVASDGSTDATDEIVKSYSDRGVRLFRQDGRVGKTITQNNAVAVATGEIIVFSDATTEYSPDILDRVLPHFADGEIGCVAGRLIYVDDESTTIGSGAKGYWNYETFIKQAESRACSLIGASGALYAVRRDAYVPMYAEACSDFLICTMLYRNGYRSVFEPDAVCYETTNVRSDDEMRMRIRVIAQTFTDLWRNRDMLLPWRSGFYAIQLFSHKLLRYAVPLLLVIAFVSNAVLAFGSSSFLVLFVCQIAGYLAALVGFLLERSGLKAGPLAFPMYFILANVASVAAFVRFLRGDRFASWEPIRDQRN